MRVSLLHLSLIAAIGAFSEEPSCHPGWQQVNRFCYKLPGSDVDGMKSEVATWAEAGRLCQASSARLLSLDSPADDLIIKTRRAKQMWGLVWVDYIAANRSLYMVSRMEGMCPALNCTSGQYQFAPCHSYRYYMCKASLDAVEDTTVATPSSRYPISPDHYEEQQPSSGSVVFKIGGGIIASLIAVLLLWMAAGIGLVVYLRRRISRDTERDAFGLVSAANRQPMSAQMSSQAEEDSLMETKAST